MAQGTRTGNNFFSKVSNFFSYIPFFGLIPGVGQALTFGAGALGGIWDAAGWLFRGKFLSAATALGSGWAAASTNLFTSASGIGAVGNVISTVATGRNLGDNVRWGVEGITGGVTGMVGMKPTVLQSYTAGIGSVPGASTGPGYWSSRVSSERGVDANAAYASYVNGDGGAHVNELGSAYRGV